MGSYGASPSRMGRDGHWRNSQSFSRNDIPLVIFALQKAFEAMIEAHSGQDDVPHDEVI